MVLFERLGVEYVVHCGDVGGLVVFDELVGRSCTFVWGNMDYPDAPTVAYLNRVGLPIPDGVPARLTLDGAKLAVFHGHEPGFADAVETLDVDFILHGHTHAARHEMRGQTHIINPGALHRVRRKTVATLDTATGRTTFHEIAGA
jgi:putative phosphoesterase